MWTFRLNLSNNSQSDFIIDSFISNLKSDKRGYVALMYSGTARSFSANFESHIVNLMAGCPYTVHLFFHTYINDNRYPETILNSSYANYLSVNATLAYFEGYINLDHERVLFRDAVKANVFEYVPLETLRQTYNDTYDISIKRHSNRPPISGIYYMWHSQRRSEELRQIYMNVTGIDYKWVFRMRHDAVYYSNWWQQAFNVRVYNHSNPLHKTIRHDISSDWGVRPTRLYDMVYEPKLKIYDTIYVPSGWSWRGYNDQFAAMSSRNAKHYFMRILHVNRMLREEKVHPETSIRLVAQWNNITVNKVKGTICYDVVRTLPNLKKQHVNNKDQISRSCSYKRSGVSDCKMLCPKLKKINKALHDSFLHGAFFRIQKLTINSTQIRSLLINHLSHFNDDTLRIDLNTSSFYYFYRYVTMNDGNDVCLPETWPKNQGNTYTMKHFPFTLRSSDQLKMVTFNKHLTCGSLIDLST